MTLIKLEPGLECKNCKARMKIGRDTVGAMNMVLIQDQPVTKVDFEVFITCEVCATIHKGQCFVRDGVFMGCHKYDTAL